MAKRLHFYATEGHYHFYLCILNKEETHLKFSSTNVFVTLFFRISFNFILPANKEIKLGL